MTLPKPKWDAKPAVMTAWVMERLREQDDAEEVERHQSRAAKRSVFVRRRETKLEEAIRHASWWDFAPLRKLYPQIKLWINPPKGKKRSKNPFQAYGESLDVTAAGVAVVDVQRIKDLWWRHYHRKNRTGLIKAEEIAAKYSQTAKRFLKVGKDGENVLVTRPVKVEDIMREIKRKREERKESR